jgi:hypothetical protein
MNAGTARMLIKIMRGCS